MAGFGVRVHATGRKVYVVQSRGPDGPKRVTLGRHGALSADEARKRAAVVIDLIKRGESPVPAPSEPEFTLTALAELPVGAVGRSEIAALHYQLRDTPTMANAAIDILSKMFSLAEAWERIPPGRNPCRSVRRYRTRTRERFLTPEEFRRLGRALRDVEADGSVWPPAIAAIRLLLLTGCRRSEILTLRWDDVDRTAGELRLRDAKAGPRMVPLTRPLMVVLDGIARVPGSPWVIVGKRRNGCLTNLDPYWQPIRAKAGLEDVRIHDLRHSYASRALALGESLPAIGKLLGHRKVSTTARYVHLMQDAAKAAASRVGDSIGAHLETRSAEAA